MQNISSKILKFKSSNQKFSSTISLKWLVLLTSVFILFIGYLLSSFPKNVLKNNSEDTPRSNKAKTEIPDYVYKIADFILLNNQAPEGYEGGRKFHNREKKLKLIDAHGSRISYKEWDVHPLVPGQNRGPERLVSGSDRTVWYTKDHYQSFIQIK